MALNIALIFGGRSAEHEVSIRSANTLYHALKNLGHTIHCIGIDRDGLWHYQTVDGAFLTAVDCNAPVITLTPGQQTLSYCVAGSASPVQIHPDLLYPALHGPWGEDGTFQGLAAMCNLPCVGSPTLGSAIAMDKDVAKRLLRERQIAVAPWLACSDKMPTWEEVISVLGNAVFVKPAALGSSVGVRKVASADEFTVAYAEAAQLGGKVLLETEIHGREIECGVLEVDGMLLASEPGEIVTQGNHPFYDYNAKYEDDNGAQLLVPAEMPHDIKLRIQGISRAVFRCLELKTLARIDFFLTADNRLIVNEANTLPGFTSISMYPRMFARTGYPLEKLVDTIVQHTLLTQGKTHAAP